MTIPIIGVCVLLATAPLGQTTQPAGGFSTWSPAEWVVFLGAIATLIGVVATQIVNIINTAKARRVAEAAQVTATAAKEVSTANASHAVRMEGQMTDMGRAVGKVEGMMTGTGDGTAGRVPLAGK